MKYVNQLDYPHIPYITRTNAADAAEREKGQHTTIATSGCGLCSAIMVAERLLVEPNFTLEDAIRMSYDTGANAIHGTDYELFAPAFAERFGLIVEPTNDPERLRRCLRTGGCAVMDSAGDSEGHIGVFSHGGHYVVIVNEQEDGRLAVLDPALKEGKYEEEGRKGKVELQGLFILTDMQNLLDDTAPHDPRFYLFWRK